MERRSKTEDEKLSTEAGQVHPELFVSRAEETG
jgi:hypothetical protein